MKEPYCMICGKPLKNGIILSNGRGICNNCEKRLVKLDINTDFYEYYKVCIRKNIMSVIKKGEEYNCQNYHL